MSSERDQLFGRDAELGALTAMVRDVSGGPSRCVLVSGEAGIGKSRLLDELAMTARAAGFLVFSGRAAEFEADVPFALVIDAFDSYLRTLDERDVERLWADRLGALAAVFPSLHGLGGAVDVPVNAGERFRVYRAVGELIERLTARQPVLVVLDDLHWADAASLELAAHLVRRPPDGPVMLAFGLRSGATTAAAERQLAILESAAHVRRISLAPLDRGAVAALVGVDVARLGRLYELSLGNPFFALQLAGTDAPTESELAPSDVPAAVQSAIRVEFDTLSATGREVAASAAVVGDPFDLDLTLSASGLSEDALLDGLDELCQRGLVRTTRAPRIFEFRHPLVRSAIYSAVPPGTRIARHRRIGEQLIDRDAGPVELARHIEHSARHGDMEAIGILSDAAEAVMAQAPASAARWITTALTLLPASEPPQLKTRLLGELAMAHAAAGDLATGLDTLHHSLSLIPPGADRALAAVAIACAQGERLLGHPDVAGRTLRHAHEQLSDQSSAVAVGLCLARSATAFYRGAYDEVAKWADEAERIAIHLDDPGLMTATEAARTNGFAMTGRIEQALELQRKVQPLLDAVPDDHLLDYLDVLSALSVSELYLDLYDDAYRNAVRGLEIARRSGLTHLMPVFVPVGGTAGWMSGRIDAAVELLDDAIEAARVVENPSLLSWHLYNRAIVAWHLGETDDADRLSAESWQLAAPLGDALIPGYAAAVRASVLRDLGRPADALELLVARAGGDELTLIAGGWRGVWFEVMTMCHLDLGDLAAAATASARARSNAEVVPVNIARVAAERAQSQVALATGAVGDAVELARSALEHAVAMRSPPFVASAHELLGRACVASGDVGAAVSALEAASAMYDELRALRLRDRVDADLRSLGRTVHRRTRAGDRTGSGVASLTGRELEVAELIGTHATNRQIANELFLSLKTVETHIRNIFNKLGVTSRSEITDVLASFAGAGSADR